MYIAKGEAKRKQVISNYQVRTAQKKKLSSKKLTLVRKWFPYL
jgi:hypothetical protein